jgi:hypothetical protein
MRDIVSAAAELVGILVILIAGFSWIASAWLKRQLAELRPNGGSSIKDKVDKLEEKLGKLEGRVDDIYLLLVESRSTRKKK